LVETFVSIGLTIDIH